MQQQMQAAMRLACQGGVILALPSLPGATPRRDASPEERDQFEDRALQLSAIAALSGAPQVLTPQCLVHYAVSLKALRSGSTKS